MNAKTSWKKRAVSVLLAAIMLLSMAPLSVFAADGSVAEVTIGSTTTPYSDLASAFTAVQYASGSVTVKLLDDVDRFATGFSNADGVQLSNSVDVTLDLNGHYIERYNNAAGTNANKKAVFYVTGSAKLTVMDSVGGGEILQPLSEPALIVDSGASLTVLSGTISNTGAGYGIRIDGGTLTVEGGTVSTSFDAGVCVGGGTVTVTGDAKIHSEKYNALLITGESSVTLSGGTYTTNGTNKSSILTKVGKVTDLLAEGFRYADANGLDIAMTEDGQGTDSANVTVSDFGIKYIDADGAEQKCTSFTELTDASAGDLNGWYAVTGTVNIEGATGVTGGNTLNLILCDGATLNLNHTLYMLGGSTLNIYGQSGGTGTLIVESSTCQPGIGIMVGFPSGTVTVNIYGGTVTAKTTEGAQPIGSVPALTTGKANVTIAKGLKCVKTDDQNTAYAYDNTDGTSITITKCTEHKWSYTNITADNHDRTCDLCGTTETGVAHTTASYKYIRTDIHRLICACGKDYSTEYHTYTYAPNSDGLTHTATCKCAYAVDDIAHTYKGEDEICICGAVHSATYDGKNYASLQSAIDAAAPVGGTVTLARQVNENVVVTDGTVTIDLGGNRWSADISYSKKGYVPLTVNGGIVTLKNGNLFQGSSTSTYETGIVINGGSVTVEENVRVRGGTPDRDGQCPSVTLNGGNLMLKEGAALLSGLQVPENKVLADYLPEGTAFVKCSYDYDSDTVTVSDPQEFVPDVYTANKITEGMAVVSHTHDFSGGTACICGFNCEHNVVDSATGKCMICGTQVYIAIVTDADGSYASFASFDDAWIAAVDNEGSTLKLLCDVDIGKANDGILIESGKFTLDLNGKTVSGDITNQFLTVSGTADITVRNGKLINTFNTDRSDINQSCASALEIDGGTVTLDRVELIAGHGFEGVRSYAAYIFSGSLTIVDGVFTGALSVADIWGAHPSAKITSATLHDGIVYGCAGIAGFDYAGLEAIFADGSMLFDKDGKYINVENKAYWQIEGEGEDSFTSFVYSEEGVIKPHTHDSYVDGKCAECDYACPHDSGINDREASYFEKAICSICHCEYGDFAPDTTAPTGEITIQGRTWWQTVLNKISFGLFYNENASVIITATDDSYSQPGYDETKHAVKIEYLVSDTILSEEAVKASSEFREYTIPIGFSTERQYVVYVRLTDHAGNVAYAGSEGFEIDKTAPVIENMVDGGHYSYCKEITIKISEKNIKSVTLDGREQTLNSDGKIHLQAHFDVEQTLIVTDKAGNTLTVYITSYTKHDFDEETLTCRHCGIDAAAKLTAGDFAGYYATVNAAISDGLLYRDENAVVTLLRSVEKGDPNAADISLWASSASLTLDLNGYKLGGGQFTISSGNTGTTTIMSSKPGGALLMWVYLRGFSATLIMGEGISEATLGYGLFQDGGTLKIYGGGYNLLRADSGKKKTELYGGKFKKINAVTEGLTCADLLAPEYRYEGVSYADAKAAATLENVTVVPCAHASLDESGCCTGCGFHLALAVEKDGVSKNFETVESAISYAEQHDGSTVKLLQDVTLCRGNVGSLISNYYIYLGTGTYTLDLAGKALTIGDGGESLQGLTVTGGCDLTVTDTVGGGKIKSSRWGEVFEVRSDGHLTIERGDYTELSRLLANGPDSLTIKGGKFNCVASREGSDSVSPLTYLDDGCAFMLSSGEYANESNVKGEYISGRGTMYRIENVTVVSAPQTIDEQPTDLKFYLTSGTADKYVKLVVSTIEEWQGERFRITFEKEDGTVINEATATAFEKQEITLSAVNFTASDSGSYRIKLELNGHVLYSDTFSIAVAECEHPGYDRSTNKCTQCGCDLAAAVVKDGKTTGYVNFADALAAAQTDENKGCVLWLLTNVTDRVTVSGGDFKFSINGYSIGGLGVTKTAKLNIFSGTINGTVAVAKTANLIASVTNFMGAVNDLGNMSSFINCVFAQSLNAKGRNTNLNNCTINGALNVSGNEVTLTASTAYGKTTVNNGGLLRFMGNSCSCGGMLVKSGGAVEVYSGDHSFGGTITAEPDSKLTLSGGVYTEIAAKSGAKLTISGGKFKNITVNGQHLIDCLAEGKAFEDMNNGFIIDGRVGIAGDVEIVSHTHTCVWKTDTHEKLCGCGYVEAVDTEAPVISSIKDGGVYYNLVYFSVTDANDFTVTVDGTPVQIPLTGYLLLGDNQTHTITATDVAGNTVTVTVTVYKLYFVTLPRDTAGYTVKGVSAVGHGMDYEFTVKITDGYSKTENYRVLVNGAEIDAVKGDETEDTFLINNVSENLVITVEGVADITAPEVEVSIHGNSFKEFLNRITFGLFFKQTQTVEVKAEDEGSGIKKVEYLLSETAFANKDAITGDWTELTLNADRKAYFSIEPNRKAFVYVRVTDQSGNITVVNSDGVVVYTDAEAIAGIKIFIMGLESDIGYHLNMHGNTVSEVYNGTEKLNGTDYYVSWDGSFTLKNSYLSTLAAGEYTITLLFKPLGENYVDNAGNDAPAEVFLKLTVEKKTPVHDHKESDGKIYDGKSIGMPTFNSDSDGALTVEYKRADEDDTAYTTAAPKSVGNYVIRITTAETDTFKAASSTMEFEIQPREVTISGAAVSNKVYDGTVDARITSVGTVDRLVDGDDVTIVSGQAAFADKNVGTDKIVTFTGFSLTGDDAANYTLVAQPTSVTADITVKEITINGAAVESTKVYDGTTNAKITDAGTLSDNYDGENLTIVAGKAAYDDPNVGRGKKVSFTGFALAGNAAGNYQLIAQPKNVKADISVKEITIRGTAVEAGKTYDGTTVAKITNAGTLSENFDGETLTIAAGKAAYDDQNVGRGKTVTFTGFKLAGAAAANYTLVAQPDAVTADITAKEVTIRGTAVEPVKVYDGNTAAKITAAGAIQGLVGNDKVTIVPGQADYSDKDVGVSKTVTFSGFTLSGSAAANYTLVAQPDAVTADITAKEVTIHGTTVEPGKVYDGNTTAKITAAGAIQGLVGNDKVTIVPGQADYSDRNVGVSKKVSFTGFKLAGAAAANYTLVSQPDAVTADITAKGVTIRGTAVEPSKVYDGNTAAKIAAAGAIQGLVGNDKVTIVPGQADYSDKNVGVSKTMTFTGFKLTGAAAANYTLVAQPDAVTADITAKGITISRAAVESTKVYDGTTDAKITDAGTLSDNYDGENLTIVAGKAAYDNPNVGRGKTVSFAGFKLAGAAVANYTLVAQPDAVTADITVKKITISGTAVEAGKIYDGTTVAKITNAGTLSENFDGENLTIVAGKAAYDNHNVGVGKTVTFTGFKLAGAAAANYTLVAQPDAVTADITAKEVSIGGTAVESGKVYDGNTAAKITAAGAIQGLVGNDKVTIVPGQADYSDKNVGVGKTVTFTGFKLAGAAAANYTLAAQPADTTASISAKELTIKSLKVKDKQYDGRNTAEIDGTPALVGVVDGDKLELVAGTPTFDRVTVGKNIPISFTAFTLSGDEVTVSNYTLTQPSGITANIVEHVADGSEYGVNANDWINTDFIITAKQGYKLSLTDTADGEWTDTLTASDETGNGKLTFYVKNTATGVISAAVTENYKIDKTAPTGEVKLNERTAFQKFINTITFGLFFKDDVHVQLTAQDEASGVKSVLYYKSDKALTDDEVRANTDWTDSSDFDIAAKDREKFIIYVRIEDKAGNVGYIGSDGVTFDTTAPGIIGVENGKTYYVTKKVAVGDDNLASVTLNGTPVEQAFSLAGNTDTVYVIRAVDQAGNVTEYTVTMKPIAALTEEIAAITAKNVKSSDKAAIEAAEERVAVVETQDATAEEQNALQAAGERCAALKQRIADVAGEITHLTDGVNGYDADKVTSADKADIEKLIGDINTLLDGNNLTDAERAALEALKATAQALLERLASAKAATESEEITTVKDTTKEDVKLDDKEDLEKAEKALEEALRDFDGNYTEEEREELEKQLESVKEALAAVGNTEKAAEEIGKLPTVDDVKLGDKDAVERVGKLVEDLTDNEKTMLGQEALDKIGALAEKVAELEKISFAPSIIEGAGQQWNGEGGANARFRSNAVFEEFRRVLVDGRELDSANYIAYAGSTVVELKTAYLNTLSAGEHTLSIVSQNGTAVTTFTVEREVAADSPQTGGAADLLLWMALLFVSGGVLAGTVITDKKKTPMAG